MAMNNDDSGDYKFIWQDKYVILLIETRLQLDDEFDNPKMRKSKIWQKVADAMKKQSGDTMEGLIGTICDSKWRNLLQTYKKVAFKKSAGIPSSWPYYDLIHDGFGQKVIFKTTSWFEKDVEDNNSWLGQSKDSNDKWTKKAKVRSEKMANLPLSCLKRKYSEMERDCDDLPEDYSNVDEDDDSEDEKPIIQNLSSKKKKKKNSTVELLRKEISEKRLEDKIYNEEKKQRWEEKKAMEKERTQVLLQLTEALNKYASKKIELVISQRR